MACCSHPRVDPDISSSPACISEHRHVPAKLSISFETPRPPFPDRHLPLTTAYSQCHIFTPKTPGGQGYRRIRVRHVHVRYLLSRHGSVLHLCTRRVYVNWPLTARYSANSAVSACPPFGICALSDPKPLTMCRITKCSLPLCVFFRAAQQFGCITPHLLEL